MTKLLSANQYVNASENITTVAEPAFPPTAVAVVFALAALGYVWGLIRDA